LISKFDIFSVSQDASLSIALLHVLFSAEKAFETGQSLPWRIRLTFRTKVYLWIWHRTSGNAPRRAPARVAQATVPV